MENVNASWYINKNVEIRNDKNIIQLSLWRNPLGMHQALKDFYKSWENWLLIPSESYWDPSLTASKSLIVEWLWLQDVTNDQILLDWNWSYGMWDEITRILANQWFKTITVLPYSFPNVWERAKRHKVQYKSYWEEKDSIQENFDKLLNSSNNSFIESIVYIDFPNNPTWFSVNVEKLYDLVTKVKKSGWIVFLDWAFWEYNEDFSLIISEVVRRWWIVIWSTSKMHWIPDMRIGRWVLPEDLVWKTDSLVFWINHFTKVTIKKLFEQDENNESISSLHIQDSIQHNTKVNKILTQELDRLWYTVLSSNLQVPIQTVISHIHEDLYTVLKNEWKIATESLHHYNSTLLDSKKWYEETWVRMLTPHEDQLDLVIERFKKINK